MKIISADFIKSAADRSGWPEEGLPEFAFLGRSNVGKSSLINCLVGRQSLARTSSTPGRTRMINFFRINSRLIFADLPGFGYAKVSLAERKSWQEMVETYLAGREPLQAAVLILDLRREPGEAERDLIRWLEDREVPCLLVATKADKLSRGQQRPALLALAQALRVNPDQVTLFSAPTREGRDELWKRLLQGI